MRMDFFTKLNSYMKTLDHYKTAPALLVSRAEKCKHTVHKSSRK